MPPQDLLVKIKDIFTKPGFGNPFYTEPTKKEPRRLLLDDTEIAGAAVRERVEQHPILGMLGALGVAGELVGRGVEKLTGSKGAGFAANIATPIGPGFLKAAPLAVGLFGKAMKMSPVKLLKKLEPLAQEARKYKSAEEFVESQQKVFRGGEKFDPRKIEGVKGATGTSFSFSEEVADYWRGSRIGGVLEELYLSPNVKIYKPTAKEIEQGRFFPPEGFDAIDLSKTKVGQEEIRIFNPDIIKTKSQLTDFYNQAVKRVK